MFVDFSWIRYGTCLTQFRSWTTPLTTAPLIYCLVFTASPPLADPLEKSPSNLTYIPQNEFRPDPLCHRGLRQISENFVHMDLFTPGPPRLPHDGEHLYGSHAALSLPRELELGSREPVLLPRRTEPELQPLGFLLLLCRCPAAEQPDWARPMWPRMGVQQGDFPKYNSHRGTVGYVWTRDAADVLYLLNHRWKVGLCNFSYYKMYAPAWKQVESVVQL